MAGRRGRPALRAWAVGLAAWFVAASGAATAQTPAPAPAPVPAATVRVALEGVVLLSAAAQVRAQGWPASARPPAGPAGPVDASRVALLDNPQAIAPIVALIGRPIGAGLISALAGQVERYYRSLDRPFVRVTIPRQDVTNGILQVLVVESRLGTISIQGDRWFDAGQYRNAIQLRPGARIDSAELRRDLDWINRNPYRHVTSVASPGTQPGTTNLTIRTQERLPLSVDAGIDNTGNTSTGLGRPSVGIDWGDFLGRGDDLRYQLTLSGDGSSLRQHSLTYTGYLPWRHLLTLQGSVVTFNASGSSPLSVAGRSETADARYIVPIGGGARLQQQITGGFDFKSTNNDLLFGGLSVFSQVAEIEQFSADYGASLSDGRGRTSVDVTATFSPGGLSGHNTDAAFDRQRQGATAEYLYVRGVVHRSQRLVHGFTADVRGTWQVSDANLLASEQLGFGGFQSIRGFHESLVTRDNGLIVNVELRDRARHVAGGDRLVLFIFTDVGAGWQHHVTDGEMSRLRMWSAGPGLDYRFGRHVAARVSYGFVIRHVGVTEAPRGEVHFGVRTTY